MSIPRSLLLFVLILPAVPRTQGTLPATRLTEAGDTYRVSVALGDVDGDGIADLVIGGDGRLALRRGASGAPVRRFAAAEPIPSSELGVSCESPGEPRLADVDGDGDLDLVAIDSPFGRPERVVWWANDGDGTFRAPRALRGTDGRDIAWQAEARSCALADWDGDGHLDLLLALPELVVHRGSPQGFAAEPDELGVRTVGFAIADWDGDGARDVILVDGEQLVVRARAQDGLGPAEVIAQVEGDPGQVRVATGDWDGDGKVDLLVAETLRRPAPPADPERAAEAAARWRVATQIIELIRVERARLDASPPPLRDPAAMARREQRRAELDAWAAGPRATVEELNGSASGAAVVGSVRVLSRS